MSDDICPFKIVLPTEPLVPLQLSPNKTADFKKIEFYIHDPVLLRLLVCKEGKINLSDCLFPKHKNPDAAKFACNSQDELAHIYIRHEIMNNVARSCLILFIDTMYLFTPNGLLKLFADTVNWLNIAQEKPYFCVVLRYKEPKTTVNTEYNRRIVNRELRRIYKGYSHDEDICTVYPAAKTAELLRIDHIDTNKKFEIKPK